MQTSQLKKTDMIQTNRQTDRNAWHLIRGGRDTHRSRVRHRRWLKIRARSSAAMCLFAPLFVLVWLSISVLMPQNHMAAGAVMLLILGAEAVSTAMYLISDAFVRST